MLQDYGSFSTSYGNKADLRQCIAALHKHAVKAVADVVINHRCAQEQVPCRPLHGPLPPRDRARQQQCGCPFQHQLDREAPGWDGRPPQGWQ